MLVQYLGLTVEQDTALRKELREAGVQYKVYKNTMMKRAFEGTEFAELDQHLDGPNALAVSKDDPVVAERILAKYVKAHKCFNFVGGVIEGQYADPDKLQEMARIRTSSRRWQTFRPGKSFSDVSLAACSRRSRTSLALSSRSRKRTAKAQRKRRQQKPESCVTVITAEIVFDQI